MAKRSSDAAKEIKALIGASSEQVEKGVGLVDKAGGALTGIVGQVGNISDLIGDIATGAKEQSAGIAEINTGVTQLDQVTQQNAAMVEQSTAASMTLKQEAASLTNLVSRFRLQSAQANIPTTDAPVPSFKSRPRYADEELQDAEWNAELPQPAAVIEGSWRDF